MAKDAKSIGTMPKNKTPGKDWTSATSDPETSAMIGGVANGRGLTRTARKNGQK